jgi:DNA-binding beta-propeller fold protein YncE
MSSFAKAVMEITLDSGSSIPVDRSGGSGTATFNVKNNSSKILTQITIDPAFGLKGGAGSVTLGAVNTCVSLSPGASCTFEVNISGSTSFPDNFSLSPRVCAYNNTVCSQPTKANRPHVIVVTQAYIANTAAPNVAVCAIDSSSNQLMSCLDATFGIMVDHPTAPVGLAINSAGTRVYVTNSNSGVILLCTVGTGMNGKFSSCQSTGLTFVNPQGITLNSAETFAYVADFGTSIVAKCPINNLGELTSCTATGNDFDGPTSIAFNSGGTLAYVTNKTSNTVSVCNVTTTGNNIGNLTDCTQSAADFSFPQTIDLNSGNNLAFISNYLSTSISVCKITDLTTGTLSSCTLSNQTINNPFGLALVPNNNFIYITQPSTNSVYLCSVNTSNGSLSNCAVTETGGVLASPAGIVLN